MHKTINNIAQIIKAGNKVALYALTPQTSQIIFLLQKNYGVAPCCVIDSDRYQHGKKFVGIDVLSLEKAILKWGELKFFCASDWYNSAIIGNLLSNNISESHIINYEPVEKYRSCFGLENMCMIGEHKARFCCEFEKSPWISNQTNMVKEFSLLQKETIVNLKNGKPTSCDNCKKLQENYFFTRKRIRGISIGEGGRCNFNCQYCVATKRGAWDMETECIDCFKFVEKLMEHEDKQVFGMDIAIGEVTILPERRAFYALAEDHSTVVATNASIFDPDLANLLAQGLCTLNISLDAGTKETFAKIKGVDCFEKVNRHILQYRTAAGYSAFYLKYIFLSGVNTGSQDVLGFVEICKKLSPISVKFSYDMLAPEALTDDTIQAMHKLYMELDHLGVVMHFDFIAQKYIDMIRMGAEYNG